MIFLSLFKHLLPRSRVWNITTDSNLRKFFLGLTWLPQMAREYIDALWWDQFAAYTTRLDAQERQWGLPPMVGTDQARRGRLAARKADTGGQSLAYIQAQLRGLGFDVYVHPWFESDPVVPPAPAVARDPRLYLAGDTYMVRYRGEAGEPLAEAGEPTAAAGDTVGPAGYALVNILETIQPLYTGLAGEPWMEAGEPDAEAGAFDIFEWIRHNYRVPSDPDAWRFFAYIGGPDFPGQANVPAARRKEFEAAALKLCPARLWLGLLVNYN